MAERQCTACGIAAKYLRPETGYRCKLCRRPEQQQCAGCSIRFSGRKRKYCTEQCQRQASQARRVAILRATRTPRYPRSWMYSAWRNAQRYVYSGSLEEYAEYRERKGMGCTKTIHWYRPQRKVAPRPHRPRQTQDERRQRWREYQRMRRVRDADKTAARRVVQRAVERGRMRKPQECQGCHRPTQPHLLHGHHAQGYQGAAKALVEWLCMRCHVIAEGRVAAS